jgi:hypothetical protein
MDPVDAAAGTQPAAEAAATELHRVVLLLVARHGARPHMVRYLRLAGNL